jgi:ElaB/YqjD/DUF883 family membrane-anchored ribosome-binding protein
MNAEQKNPEELRDDIAETRELLGDTVEALANKADIKGQAKAKVDSAKAGAQEKLGSARESAQQIAGNAQENPVPVAIAAAFAAGVVVGWILAR